MADVLDASHFGSGHVPLHESEFSLNELIADECRQSSPAAAAKGLNLRIAPGAPEIRLYADRIKLARAIRNLVSNAIKFTSVGFVELGCSRRPDGDALVYVRDSGPGIAAGDLDRLFAEFARFGSRVTDIEAGWGLGLPICRRLVALMGGTVTVESRLNEGSTFTVRIPSSRVRGSSSWSARDQATT